MKQIIIIMLAIGCIFTLSPATVYGNGSITGGCEAELIAGGGNAESAYPVGLVVWDWQKNIIDCVNYGYEDSVAVIWYPFSPYCINEIHHDIQMDAANFPQTKKHNLIPGQFWIKYDMYDLYGMCYPGGIGACIPYEDICSMTDGSGIVWNATHLSIGMSEDGMFEDSAWAMCTNESCVAGNVIGKNWATYFGCEVPAEICVEP